MVWCKNYYISKCHIPTWCNVMISHHLWCDVTTKGKVTFICTSLDILSMPFEELEIYCLLLSRKPTENWFRTRSYNAINTWWGWFGGRWQPYTILKVKNVHWHIIRDKTLCKRFENLQVDALKDHTNTKIFLNLRLFLWLVDTHIY